jgi:NAD(P)H-hydrate repair Nnr-like enzyme with NAD(P)H-hydrate epimerase domain
MGQDPVWHDPHDPAAVAYTAAEALAMDQWLVEGGATIEALMAVAGARLADAARESCRDWELDRVVCLVGPGNNGGDALVAADLLDAELTVERWRPLAGDATPALDPGCLVVDGLFGVGLERPVEGVAAAALAAVAASGAPVLAVDVPSGLHATTGEVLGAALPARRTLTFVGPKVGFFLGRGPELVGRWRAVDIGFPVGDAHAWLQQRRAAEA